MRRRSAPKFEEIKQHHSVIASASSAAGATAITSHVWPTEDQRQNLWILNQAGRPPGSFIAYGFQRLSFLELQEKEPKYVSRQVSAKVVAPSAKWLISDGPAYEELDEPLIKLGRLSDRHFIYGVFNYDYALYPSFRIVDYDPFTLTTLDKKTLDCGTIFGSWSPLGLTQASDGVRYYFTNGRSMQAYKERNGVCLTFGNRDFFRGKGVFNFAPFHSGFKNELLFDGDLHDFKTETELEVKMDEQSKTMCRNNFRSFDVRGNEAIFSCQNVGWTKGRDFIIVDKNFDR